MKKFDYEDINLIPKKCIVDSRSECDTSVRLGKFVFDLYQNHGFPFEVSYEIYKQKGKEISHNEFIEEFNKHRAISR